MDEMKLKSAGVDYDMALERFVGNRMLYEKFLKKYIEDAHVADAKAAYKESDYHEMLAQVHALKGVAGTLGMDGLYQISAGIVEALRKSEYGNLTQQMEALDAEHQRILQVLENA